MIYDVIVVGSGPGGAITAATIAKRRKAVLLVDRQAFPRDKVCGDGLPGNVRRMLAALDINTDRYGLHFQRIHGIAIEAPSGKSLVVRERPSKYYSMVSPRYHFDFMLHDYALRAGAKFAVMDVYAPLYDQTGNTVIGIVERKGKQFIEHEARVVIAADGATSPIARSVRGRVADVEETALAIRAYAKLRRPLDEKPLVYLSYLLSLVPGYAWIFPTSRDEINIGLGIFDQAVYKQLDKGLRTLLDDFIATMQAEFPMDVDPKSIRTWQIPVWTTPESRVVKGAYLVGDAGRFVDALTGGGIFPAMVTGRLAGQAAVSVLKGTSESEAAAAFDAGWRGGIGKSLHKLLLVQRWVGSRPRVFSALFHIANSVPPLRGVLLNSLAGQHA
jgi:geranylgeranyl reductase family protein